MKTKHKLILAGILPILVGIGFLYGSYSAISDGHVSEGGRRNKTTYTKKDNPKEFNRIVGGMFMIGSIAIIVGSGLIAFGASEKQGKCN